MRSWTYIDERDEAGDESPRARLERAVREKQINELVSRWNRLEKLSERRSYFYEDDREDYEEELRERRAEARAEAYQKAIASGSTEDEAKELAEDAAEQVLSPMDEADLRDQAEQEAIVAMLHGLGARLMRPYEHWNEDERYMEYMENRY